MHELENGILVTVIIVSHNDGSWLPRCLESLRTQTLTRQIEVLLADNASSDGTDQLAQKLIADWPNARFMSTGGDNGFGVACNRASERARGKYLYLLNPDTWAEPDCVEQLYRTAESTRAAAVGSMVLDYDSQVPQGASGIGFDFCGNTLPSRDVPEVLLSPNSFFFIRRDIFMRLGMMDTKMFMYGEENDLSWRIWIAGERIVPALQARIHHRGAVNVNPGGGTPVSQNRTSTQKRFLANRNRLVFIAKDCQHLLLLMLLPCLGTVVLEALATLILARSWRLAKASCIDAVSSFWSLRGHIRQERRQVASFRRRGDLWMLRFFRFGFGRWAEITKILKTGFPRFR